jgi:hypothetical protein
MAKVVLSAVPSEPVEELERLSSVGDAAATRKLGDVFNIGFKGVARDWMRGCDLYRDAAGAGDLEAMGCIQVMGCLLTCTARKFTLALSHALTHVLCVHERVLEVCFLFPRLRRGNGWGRGRDWKGEEKELERERKRGGWGREASEARYGAVGATFSRQCDDSHLTVNFLSSQAMAFLKLEQEHPDAINDGYPAKITPELLANPTFEMAVECMGDAAKMGHLTPIAVVRVKQTRTLDSGRKDPWP